MKLPDHYAFNDAVEIGVPIGLAVVVVFVLSLMFGFSLIKFLLLAAAFVAGIFGLVMGITWLIAFAIVNYEDWQDRKDGR